MKINLHFHKWEGLSYFRVPKQFVGNSDDRDCWYRVCVKCGEIQRQHSHPFMQEDFCSCGWVTIKRGDIK